MERSRLSTLTSHGLSVIKSGADILTFGLSGGLGHSPSSALSRLYGGISCR